MQIFERQGDQATDDGVYARTGERAAQPMYDFETIVSASGRTAVSTMREDIPGNLKVASPYFDGLDYMAFQPAGSPDDKAWIDF